VPDRDFFNPAKVSQGLADNGGAAAIRLVHYAPQPALEGKTLDVIAEGWQVDPVTAYMRIVRATSAEVNSSGPPLEEIIGTSMSEDDVRWFIAQPAIMFCSDGDCMARIPRGEHLPARILGRYVREERSCRSAGHSQDDRTAGATAWP
jgi:N-acyl-D-aspartate/D-glutamate deacylase